MDHSTTIGKLAKYYLYAHSTTAGEVFYVGKGSGNRLHQKGNRSAFWKNYSRKHGCIPSIIQEGLTEEQAYNEEIRVIAAYKAMGLCVVNVSLGGDGVRVSHRWWGDAISKSMTGMRRPAGRENPSFKDAVSRDQLVEMYVDRQMSTPQIANITGLSYTSICSRLSEYGISKRNAGRTSKTVVCVDDGKVFCSISEAARHYGIFRENISKVLKGIYGQTGGRRFSYGS